MDAMILKSEPDIDHADYYLTANYGVENRGLIQFDLSSLTGATINYASLSLYNRFNYGYNINIEFGVYRNTAPWDEWTVTWDNYHDEPIFLVSVIFIENAYTDTWYSWEITSVVRDWVDGVHDNYGLTIKRMDEENPFLTFVSSDHYSNLPDSWDPELYVEFTSNVAPCEGDIAPADGDVDGSDLAAYIANQAGINLNDFAADFGRTDCPGIN